MMRTVYMDHAAATPVSEGVLAAMMPYFRDQFGNPQAVHEIGNRAAAAVEEARARVADLIRAPAEEILFTASGSEANNLAVKGIALANQKKGNHVVVSAVEHFSVLHAAKTLKKSGFEVTEVPVDPEGRVDPGAVRRAITDRTALVSVMHANNEVGTIEPIPAISAVTRERGIPFHTDAWATAGKIPVDVGALGVDSLSVGGQGFGGPQGTGALWVRKGTRIRPLIDGGVQEGGRRGGTENVPALVGMGRAAVEASESMEENRRRLLPIRDELSRRLVAEIEGVVLTGHPTERLPNHVSVCVEGVEGEAMLLLMAQQGIYASSGSACTSRALKASHVLLALGLDAALAQGSIVFTLGPGNTREDAAYVMDALPKIVQRLREMSPIYRAKPAGDLDSKSG